MNKSLAPAASLVLCEKIHLESQSVALLTLNRPEQRNPLARGSSVPAPVQGGFSDAARDNQRRVEEVDDVVGR
jgi:hypothetical protein